jgi:hypothetical protein
MFRPLLILLTDTGGVHLVTPSGSMTKSYETVLMRNQATKPSHAKHIQHWYGWSARVTIDNEKLTAHGAYLRKKSNGRPTVSKLVLGIRPACKMCIGKINVAMSAPFVMTPQKIGTTFSNVHTRAKERGGEPKSYQMWRINAIPYGRPICYRRGSCAVHQKDGSIMTLMNTHLITQSTHRQFTAA